MKQEIRTEIVIESSNEKVYQILTDLSSYEKWNPFIIRSEGIAETGAILKNTMKTGKKEMVFKPRVIKADHGKAFEWLGSLWIKGLFDGHHYFIIEELDDTKVNLIHGERFSGLLAKMILKNIAAETREGFIQMNRSLKKQAENQ